MSESMSPPLGVLFRIRINQHLFDPFAGTPVGEHSLWPYATGQAGTGRPLTTPASVRRAGQ